MVQKKRKTNSPLLKDSGKNPRTSQNGLAEESADERDSPSDDAVISDLKEFIRAENARNSKALAEEMRRYNDERVTALENSLSFALTVNETLAKRLSKVEERYQKAETGLFHCARRLAEVEEQVDQVQWQELQHWLIFSGPVISRVPGRNRGEDTARLLQEMVWKLMDYEMDPRQLEVVHRDQKQIRARFSSVAEGSDRHFLVRNKTRLRGTALVSTSESASRRADSGYSRMFCS